MDDKHYVVRKPSGSRYARVVHVPTGQVVKSYDVLREDGWAMADRHCAGLNEDREKALAEIGKGRITMVTPEMLLFLAGKMGLPKANIHEYRQEVCYEPRDGVWLIFNPATDDAQFGRLVVWAAMQGLEPDFSHGIVRVWPIGKDYPCAEENVSTPDSIRAAAVVAVCRALNYEDKQ